MGHSLSQILISLNLGGPQTLIHTLRLYLGEPIVMTQSLRLVLEDPIMIL